MEGTVQISLNDWEDLKGTKADPDRAIEGTAHISIEDFDKLKQKGIYLHADVEGKALISLKEFMKLREQAESYNKLISIMNECISIDEEESPSGSECWVRVYKVNAKKLAHVAVENTIEDIHQDDIIKVIE